MAVTDRYDDIYRRYAPGVPVAYLQALAEGESGSNPRSKPDHGHWGLLQISETIVSDYNKQHGTDYTHSDVLDPSVNVRMWMDYYTRIVGRVFDKLVTELGPKAKNFVPDWKNPQYVGLVTAAWNSGIGAVRGAVRYGVRLIELTQPLVGAITIDDVFRWGRRWAPLASTAQLRRKRERLFSEKKKNWQWRVVMRYVALAGLRKAQQIIARKKGIGIPWWVIVLGLWFMRGRR